MNLRRSLRVIGVNLLVLGAGVTAVELGFGGWLDSTHLNRLNLTKDRKRVYDVRRLYPSASGVAVSTRDRYGLRGSFGDPSRIGILTVGGSTTDQRFITDGETWQDVLQADFVAEGMQVFVANAGVDGQSTYGHIKDFDWWFPAIPGLKPGFVVFYVGINDFYRDEDYERDDLLGDGEGRRTLRRRLEEDSAIFHLFRTLKGMYQAEVVHKLGHESIDFPRVKWTDQPLIRDPEAVMRPRLAAYAERLRALCARTRKMGAVPVFVTQPSRMYKLEPDRVLGAQKPFRYGDVQINGVDFHAMMKLLNDRTLAVCRSEGGIPINLAEDLAFEDREFYDFYHMTPAGAAKVGHYLFGKLSDPVRAAKGSAAEARH